MTRVIFHPEAEAEFQAAARFYDAHTPGLGRDFIAEVRRAARTLATYPGIGHRFSRRLRRLLVRRFPYGLLYRTEPDRIFIVAVAHLRRRPGYWRRRR
ncbi:MAG TPA: type II toxin-antitoxin system RelE/ParE family toxin [bacterium]|nr:type II toxin-antitoxin system RelE/ParE family toxin [bacterium]